MSGFDIPDLKIGSKVGPGAGSGPREKVIRTAADRNEALRNGEVRTLPKQTGLNV
jgi:hypothetical protein